MKVLFAVSDDNITTAVVSKYQQKFKEIITSKNVYYFNAIIKELQKDKTYDAVVIGEDLEPISNNNYEAVDKFIFDKLDSISDEAYKISGDDIPIILICADRRTKSDQLLIKLFGIGVYNAIIGNDRSIDTVCNLIAKPRSKKEAKVYYKIESNDVEYKPENESDVSESEIQSILNHYKKIGSNEKKCIESFDSIAEQYTDAQLRLIVNFLPMNVKAILESGSPKYQQLMTKGTVLSNGKYVPYKPVANSKVPGSIDILTKDLEKPKLTEPVIIPSTMKSARNQNISNANTNSNANNNSYNNNPNNAYSSYIRPEGNDVNYGNTNYNTNMQGSTPYGTNIPGSNTTPYGTNIPGSNTTPYGTNIPGNNTSPYGTNMQDGSIAPYGVNMQGKTISPYGINAQGGDTPPYSPSSSKYDARLSNMNNNISNSDNTNDAKNNNPVDLTEKDTSNNKNENKKDDDIDSISELVANKGLNNSNNEENKEIKQNIANVVKKRGRPRKIETKLVEQSTDVLNNVAENSTEKKRRGRPKKLKLEEIKNTEESIEKTTTMLPGFQEEVAMQQNNDVNLSSLPGLETENKVELSELNKNDDNSILPEFENENNILPGIDTTNNYTTTLPGLETNNYTTTLPGLDTENISKVEPNFKNNSNYQSNQNNSILNLQQANVRYNEFNNQNNLNNDIQQNYQVNPYSNVPNYQQSYNNNQYQNLYNNNVDGSVRSNQNFYQNENQNTLMNQNQQYSSNMDNTAITGNGKIVSFVGTSKNGTSFIVNNLAQLLSQSNVKVAIVDLTQNRNAYYMYTDNDSELVKKATQSLENLSKGLAQGLDINSNLTIYTALPGEMIEQKNLQLELKTLTDNYNVILMDCDFSTNTDYFVNSNEIYLVQSMDALTIQPLTQFLSELKTRNLLDETKLRVIINKYIKLKRLDDKMIIAGMSRYNEPSMTLQRDLFNKDTIKYIDIPFEEQTYARYLEEIALCQVSLNGYSQYFIAALEQLKNMVYPLVSGNRLNNYSQNNNKKRGLFSSKNNNFQTNTQFSGNVNNTLNKMRSNF